MKHFLLFACLALCLSLNACQCSDKPDIGPVEGQDRAAVEAGWMNVYVAAPGALGSGSSLVPALPRNVDEAAG